MSKKNYNKISTEKAKAVDEAVEETVLDTVEEEVVETTIEKEPEYLEGTVSGCSKLNIRKTPDANGVILGVEPVGTYVTVFPDESTEAWYRVVTDSQLDGYCMRKFISIKE